MRTAWTVERYEAAHCSNTNDTLTTVPQVTALGYHFWIFAGVLFAFYLTYFGGEVFEGSAILPDIQGGVGDERSS